jgi:type II secretory pathway component PulF
MKKNKEFLSSEKEESQTFIRALISFQKHTINQIIFHSTTEKSKSLRKGRRTQDLLQKHAIFTAQKLSSQLRFIHPNLDG